MVCFGQSKCLLRPTCGSDESRESLEINMKTVPFSAKDNVLKVWKIRVNRWPICPETIFNNQFYLFRINFHFESGHTS